MIKRPVTGSLVWFCNPKLSGCGLCLPVSSVRTDGDVSSGQTGTFRPDRGERLYPSVPFTGRCACCTWRPGCRLAPLNVADHRSPVGSIRAGSACRAKSRWPQAGRRWSSAEGTPPRVRTPSPPSGVTAATAWRSSFVPSTSPSAGAGVWAGQVRTGVLIDNVGGSTRPGGRRWPQQLMTSRATHEYTKMQRPQFG